MIRSMVALAIAILVTPALAQHPAHDMPLHEKFYSNWFMPDQPNKSCCNKADCYPTQVLFHDNHWYAQRREDGMWLFIPDNKVERNRDNPDGRSHVCAPPPLNFGFSPFTVFCFSLGGAT